MKNHYKLKAMFHIVGITAIIAVIGFSMVACDSGSGGDDGNSGSGGGGATAIEGTWRKSNGYQITFQGNTWTYGTSSRDFIRGTWTSGTTITIPSSGTLTIIATETNYNGNGWVPQSGFPATNVITYSVTASAFTISSATETTGRWDETVGVYQKQGTTGGNTGGSGVKSATFTMNSPKTENIGGIKHWRFSFDNFSSTPVTLKTGNQTKTIVNRIDYGQGGFSYEITLTSQMVTFTYSPSDTVKYTKVNEGYVKFEDK
jgi:hypothetical protein